MYLTFMEGMWISELTVWKKTLVLPKRNHWAGIEHVYNVLLGIDIPKVYTYCTGRFVGHKPCYLNSFSSALTSAQIPRPLCTLWWHSDWNTLHMSPCPNGHYCSRIPEGHTHSIQEQRLTIKKKRRNLYLSLLQRILPFLTASRSLPRRRM